MHPGDLRFFFVKINFVSAIIFFELLCYERISFRDEICLRQTMQLSGITNKVEIA